MGHLKPSHTEKIHHTVHCKVQGYKSQLNNNASTSLALGPRTPRNTRQTQMTAEFHDEFPFKITHF